jgi:hypothetical protein
MESCFTWSWVESQVSASAAAWSTCAGRRLLALPQYSPREQQKREDAYDEALLAVEREARLIRHKGASTDARRRVVAVFPRFASVALGLEDDAVRMLNEGFLPIGTQFAQWAKHFDPTLSMADTTQACRNVWTACGLQPLVGDRMELAPAIIGYSLLYPYSDNYLDSEEISTARKLEFSARFRDRLCGLGIAPRNRHESAIWSMVRLIEEQFSRQRFPQVYDCLLAIHQAQENSIAQSKHGANVSESEILRLSCAKGGTSVLADACLSHGFLRDEEARFAFDWGVLLQLGDDVQDVQDDLKHGSATLFSRAADAGVPLDNLVRQLLAFSEGVADQADALPNGELAFKRLLRTSWQSLILMAVARSYRFFSEPFLAEMERSSPFRFHFQRARHKRLSGRRGLYKVLFESFLASEDTDLSHLPCPETWLEHGQICDRPEEPACASIG